jgi:hypothetical protein
MMLDDLIDHPNKTNWAFLVKTLLDNLGFSDAWISQGVGDVNVFFVLCESKTKRYIYTKLA